MNGLRVIVYLAFGTMTLLYVRNAYPWTRFVLAASLFLAVAWLLWVAAPMVAFYYRGPLNAFGFYSWTIVASAVSSTVICAVRSRYAWVRILQGLAAAGMTYAFITSAMWIA